MRVVQVKRSPDGIEIDVELNDRDGDVRPDADDYGLRSPQPKHDRERSQGARDERVDHVKRRHVDDHSARAVATHPFCNLVTKRQDLAVAQIGLNRRDEVVALTEDRDGHATEVTSRVRPRLSRVLSNLD